MKRVPADEFADHAAEYLAGREPISVEKDGEVIGQYLPIPAAAEPPNGTATNGHAASGVVPKAAGDKIRPEAREVVERLDRVLQEIYARTGMTEEEFAAYFDTTKPFPYDADTKV